MQAPGRRVHFVGIGGAGMSALAKVLLAQGVAVSGSDIAESPVLEELRARGAHVFVGHDARHVDGASEVVVSSAITADNPEVETARARGIPVRHRSELLAELLNQKEGITVAGAHGKTTVTSMIAWTLHRLGQDPTFLIGGELPGLGGAGFGEGPLMVAEADESDRTFLRYRPKIAVVTSVEPDHLESYGHSFEALKEAFLDHLRRVKPGGWAVLCADDPGLREVAGALGRDDIALVWYGLDEDAYFRAGDIDLRGFQSRFRVRRGGRDLGEYTLSVPGRHNVQNALACIATLDCLGLPLEPVRDALSAFRGARRRFEVVAEENGILVIDDYAHHPSEIRATLQAAKRGWNRRVVAVFQPHRYTRTSQLMEDFARAFEAADRVVLTEVYSPPPDRPIPGVSGRRLAELAREHLGDKVEYVPDVESVVDRLCAICQEGDIVVTMGAGDIWRAARAFARRRSR